MSLFVIVLFVFLVFTSINDLLPKEKFTGQVQTEQEDLHPGFTCWTQGDY